MNITVSIEIGKESFANYEEIESACYNFGLAVGREFMKKIFESIDLELLAARDTSRYRSKGFQETSIKTKLGVVDYSRRVYEDRAVTEGIHCVHLLDQELGINPVGLVSPGVCELISSSICESTYRSTARQITELTGMTISAQGVWNIVQKLGNSQNELIGRYSKLASANQGLGEISTKILYEENDGVWLKLQGKSREENGPSKEMKAGIAYDGTTIYTSPNGKTRRTLDNKVAYAGFESIEEFHSHKEGIIANRYNIDEIELRVVNGDGAGWVQNYGAAEDTIVMLDPYHRNKKIRECVLDKEFQKTLTALLIEKRYDDLIECIEAQINSVEDEKEKFLLQELLSYYKNNKEALPGYYDRGMEIPETRDPGNIHHARMGSMESNIFTLIGNRMKGKRRCWSISGANNLAHLLCAYHTIGFEDLFAEVPTAPVPVEKEVLTAEDLALINAPIPRKKDYRDGKGYELPGNVSTTNSHYLLRNISQFSSLSEINFKC